MAREVGDLIVMAVKDHREGQGPTIQDGYKRGDSWLPEAGPHLKSCPNCRIWVIGAGLKRKHEDWLEGVLLRCEGCGASWVIVA